MFLAGLRSAIGFSFPKTERFKGFIATHNRKWDKTFFWFKKEHPNGYVSKIDKITLDLFDKYVNYCIKNNIKLIFVNSPVYFESSKILKNRAQIDSVYKSYSEKFKIPLLDYTWDSICYDTLNFYNSQHLNTIGVIKFNTILSKDLKKILK